MVKTEFVPPPQAKKHWQVNEEGQMLGEDNTADVRPTTHKQTRLIRKGFVSMFASGTCCGRRNRWNELVEVVVFCLAKGMMSVQTVDKEGFRLI